MFVLGGRVGCRGVGDFRMAAAEGLHLISKCWNCVEIQWKKL